MHLDAVPSGEPADHEEAQLIAVEQVERLGVLYARLASVSISAPMPRPRSSISKA